MMKFHCNCGEIIIGTKRDVATHLAECEVTRANAERHAEADARACQWLARANELIEVGKAGTKAHKEAERKAQYWLDQLNKLELR